MNSLTKHNAKPSVFIFLPSLAGGGAERSMLNLAQALSREGYNTSLVLAEKRGAYIQQLDGSVEIIDLQSPRVLFSLPRLVQLLRQRKPDVLLSAMDHTNIIAILAVGLAGTKIHTIVSIQNTVSIALHQSRDLRNHLMPILIWGCYRFANRVVCVSQGVADDLIKSFGVASNLVEVIYNPVVTPSLIAQAQLPVEHPWFAPGQPPVIIGIGRLTHQKDFPTLIRAFALLRAQQDVRLIILGEGKDRATLEQLVAELGLTDVVQLPGFTANPFVYLAHAQLFVLSSIHEGLPTVLIEALACGTSVVATECPHGPREILADGKYGMLVPVGNVRALASAMAITLQHHRPIPDTALEAYRDTTVTRRYQALIADVLQKA